MTTMTTMTIIDDISTGRLDELLPQIEKALSERLMAVRSARKTTEYGVGDHVKFNTFCGTKYLHGREAVVVGFKNKKLMVKLVKPVGRFVRYVEGEAVSVEISVPPSIIDLVL